MLGWGMLGTSFISNTVARAIGESDGSRIVAVAGRDAERLEAFQGRYAIPKGYTDYDALLADEARDLVVLPLVTERASHAAAAGVQVDHCRIGNAAQDLKQRPHAYQRAFMAVALNQDLLRPRAE